jgi:hypothetical protein
MTHSQVNPPNMLPQKTALYWPPKPGCAAAICGSCSNSPKSIAPMKAATTWPVLMSMSVAEVGFAHAVRPAVADDSRRIRGIDVLGLARGVYLGARGAHGLPESKHPGALLRRLFPTRGNAEQRNEQYESRHGNSLHAGNVALAAVVSSGAIVSTDVVTGLGSLSPAGPARRSAIVSLHSPVGPAAILGRVGAIIIDAVQGHAFGPFAHIRNEVLKSLPAVAYKYASPAVSLEGKACGILASVAHLIVNPPQRMRAAMMKTMRGLSFYGQFRAQAPARTNKPGSQVVTTNLFLLPAVAKTQPTVAVWGNRFNFLKNDETAKSLAEQITFSSHACTITRHLVGA